jgi:Tol biopolymer transport system component
MCCWENEFPRHIAGKIETPKDQEGFMSKRTLFLVWLLFSFTFHFQLEARDLLFIIGRDVKNTEYDIFSANPVSLECKKIIDFGYNPVWSPDGQKIGFILHQSIKGKEYSYITGLHIANKDGRQVKRVKQKTGALIDDLAWSPDGQKIAMVAGKWILIATLDEEIMAHQGPNGIRYVDWLSDGNRVVFDGESGISLFDLRNKEAKLVAPKGVFPRIIPGTNKLLYLVVVEASGGQTNIVRKDLKSGVEETLIKDITSSFPKRSAYCVSGDGRKIIFHKGGPEASRDEAVFGVYDVAAKTIKYSEKVEGMMEAVSHDGTKIAGVFRFDDKAGYGIYDLATRKKSPIKEIGENEMDKRVFGFSKLMDW